MNITESTGPARQRVRVRVRRAPTVRRTAVLPARAWVIGVGLAMAIGAVIYAGAANADEGISGCADIAPIVLVKHSAAISYAPHHTLIHQHRLPAALRKREVGCTAETLPEAVAPLSVPAAEEVAAPVAADVIPPAAVETPRGAVAAAAVGDQRAAALPLAVLVAYIGVCVVGRACDEHSGTTGGHSISSAGTTGTTAK